ncbi:uncharacterized protein LOC106882666 [Octopus bimaculoides]|uniref:uncharacterized protein LOC106882666 n=1 Tax=Octopus bimaculoides TaxID=37653 RepID=UPI00071D1006|nr:uncharacterized protein LOC106882666 [Octopus bimaculoides]|eukprot:XP_014788915.1 PREDICTED: uncharacterized protein LOC106882666 [Octopus bimaculoides]
MSYNWLILSLSLAVVTVQICQGFVSVETIKQNAIKALNEAIGGVDTDQPILFAQEPVAVLGNISKDILKMDLAPKIMMYEFDKKTYYTYGNMVESLSTAYFAIRESNLAVKRGDKFIKKVDDWEFSTPPQNLKKEVGDWIEKLVGKEFAQLFSLDSKHNDVFLKYVSKSLTAMSKKCRLLNPDVKTRGLVNIPIVVYPTLEDDKFHVYRIIIDDWVSCQFINDKGGLTGDFQKATFAPRKDVVEHVSKDIREKLEKLVNDKYAPKE